MLQRELRAVPSYADSRDLDGHPFESDRLRALASYAVMDSGDEPAFDVLVDSAAELIGSDYAAITLIDARRHWCKAMHGDLLREGPREWSICSDVVRREHFLVVSDITVHPRYANNPATFGPNPVGAYAGVPLIGRDGLALGTFSVSHATPRTFTDRDLAVLGGLARAAAALLEERRSDLEAGRLGRHGEPAAVDHHVISA